HREVEDRIDEHALLDKGVVEAVLLGGNRGRKTRRPCSHDQNISNGHSLIIPAEWAQVRLKPDPTDDSGRIQPVIEQESPIQESARAVSGGRRPWGPPSGGPSVIARALEAGIRLSGIDRLRARRSGPLQSPRRSAIGPAAC